MKKFKLLFLVCIPTLSFAQIGTGISVIDFVQIKNNKRAETVFYYDNNWKVYRDIALERGLIKSYRLFEIIQDSTKSFDLILITEYSDSVQFNAREENFQKIIKEKRPNGPIQLNDLKPNDFRSLLAPSREAVTLFDGQGKKKK
jgi:hypothetical protein